MLLQLVEGSTGMPMKGWRAELVLRLRRPTRRGRAGMADRKERKVGRATGMGWA